MVRCWKKTKIGILEFLIFKKIQKINFKKFNKNQKKKKIETISNMLKKKLPFKFTTLANLTTLCFVIL